jgi:hypothetical protein
MDVKKECSGYWYTNQEYNLSGDNAWHPPKESYILANDSVLVVIDHHIETDFFVAIPFDVDVSLSGRKCKYLNGVTLFVVDKKTSTMTVNRVMDKGLETYFIYMNMVELDWEETKKILENVY